MDKQKTFPFEIKVSFHKIIEEYQNLAASESSGFSKDYMERMLEYVSSFPPLMEGIAKEEELVKYKDPVRILMKDLFPGILSQNQIKALSVPFHNIIFNSTQRFREILLEAGENYELSMRNLNDDLDYIFACIMILNCYYGYNIDFSRPLYYDIPDKNGILRHYKIEMNSDFIEILPTEKAVDITSEDVDALIQNMEEVDLWKKLFPPKSWIFKGFTIITLTDVTAADAISDLKTTLLQRNTSSEEELQKFQEIFRSIYKIADLQVGFTVFNSKDSTFEEMENGATSFILNSETRKGCREAVGDGAYLSLVQDNNYFTISNVEAYGKSNQNQLYTNLREKGVKSAILAPIAKDNKLLAILELVSFRKTELNSINATKLDDILPYIVTAVERNKAEFENRIKAVIQSECTSIHPSVLWAFEEEAKKFIKDIEEDGLASFKDIVFENIHPLYGQIDIVASSEARNSAIQKDLLYQLDLIGGIIDEAGELEQMVIYEQVKFRIDEFQEDLHENLNASSEQKVFNLLQKEINPLLDHIEKQSSSLKERIEDYRSQINSESGIIYNHRKNYDEAVQQINRTMARYLDRQEFEAQKIYPHYFERYKTDGVDHNIYLGESLTNDPDNPFDKVYLYNLRLWQLRTMCEMENRFYKLQDNLPITLEAASLILVFNNTLSIRYRMDEKQFDVDGTYNARFEIIKKRIDKACVKGTGERITQKGKIVIIYSQRNDEREYLRYVEYLQAKKYLGENVELLELEDVQGVVGLKAIRVEVLYSLDDSSSENVITYEDLMKKLK